MILWWRGFIPTILKIDTQPRISSAETKGVMNEKSWSMLPQTKFSSDFDFLFAFKHKRETDRYVLCFALDSKIEISRFY